MEVEKASAEEAMDEVVSSAGGVIGKEKPELLQPRPGAVHGGGGGEPCLGQQWRMLGKT